MGVYDTHSGAQPDPFYYAQGITKAWYMRVPEVFGGK